MSEVVVVASNLGHRFGAEFGVVDVNLSLVRGRITAFLGKNGAGKSTTMRLLAGVLVPTRGSVKVTLAGVSGPAHAVQARRHMGWAPEEAAVHPALTVREQLRFSRALRGQGDVDAVIGSLDLGSVQSRLCGTLSKGTRQRVGLAQALLTRASVLLLDEPSAGLDPTQVLLLRSLLLQRRDEGAAILWSSHITTELEVVADDISVIHAGRTVHSGSRSTMAAALAALGAGAPVEVTP